MEKHIKYRVTGLCLAITFIALLLFLLQSPKTSSTQANDTITPPPFPDQSVQVTTVSEQTITPPLPEPQPIPETQATTTPMQVITPQSTVVATPATNTHITTNKPIPIVTQAEITTHPTPLTHKKIMVHEEKMNRITWVIQLGSFKNKTNALRLVNQLRAQGYAAFTKHIRTRYGDNIRVYIGPENQQWAALTIANRLKNEWHLHGMVKSYKPLAL